MFPGMSAVCALLAGELGEGDGFLGLLKNVDNFVWPAFFSGSFFCFCFLEDVLRLRVSAVNFRLAVEDRVDCGVGVDGGGDVIWIDRIDPEFEKSWKAFASSGTGTLLSGCLLT